MCQVTFFVRPFLQVELRSFSLLNTRAIRSVRHLRSLTHSACPQTPRSWLGPPSGSLPPRPAPSLASGCIACGCLLFAEKRTLNTAIYSE